MVCYPYLAYLSTTLLYIRILPSNIAPRCNMNSSDSSQGGKRIEQKLKACDSEIIQKHLNEDFYFYIFILI